MASIETAYVSCSCNRFSHASDCDPKDGLVAFGSGSLVCFWDSATERSCVKDTFVAHSAIVSSVKFEWNPQGSFPRRLVTADTSGHVCIWSQESVSAKWLLINNFKGANGSIDGLSVIHRNGQMLIFVASTEGAVLIHQFDPSTKTLQNISTISSKDLSNKLPLSISCSTLPNSECLILVVGSTTSSFQLYVSSDVKSWKRAAVVEGHTDWVRATSFSSICSDSSLLLATGSQDNYIRLWKIVQVSAQDANKKAGSIEILDSLETDEANASLSLKQYDFTLDDLSFSCTAESVLWSHEDWITDLRWKPSEAPSEANFLLSTSADRSMIIWTLDQSTSLWTPSERFGDLHGSGGGFFGAMWGKEANTVVAHDWGGSFRKWDYLANIWTPKSGISGHFDNVNSLSWEPEGDFFVTVGSDKTTRLHGPINIEQEESTWHELNRPQVHGYSVNTVAFLSRNSFVTGSDESVIRAFEAPLTALRRLDGVGCTKELAQNADKSLPTGAMVPALGLSNRAASKDEANEEMVLPDSAYGSNEVPLEEDLLRATLWVEREKLYGHRYDIRAVAFSNQHKLIASTCKSASAEHAVVRVFKAQDYSPINQPLAGHNLTITNLAFSPNGNTLLTVSRDRGWCLFEYDSTKELFDQVAIQPKAHARIIWDCCWFIDNNDRFTTVSRDKTAKLWRKTAENKWACENTINLAQPATSVAMTKSINSAGEQVDILAVGCENGELAIFKSPSWEPLFEPIRVHSSSITRLAFNPKHNLQLASCSEDRSVRAMNLTI